MILMNVTYKCKSGARADFWEMIMANGIDVASRAEAGNIKYDYYMPVESEDEMLLVEKWTDADALASHSKQPHFVKLGELKREYVIDTIIERFEA